MDTSKGRSVSLTVECYRDSGAGRVAVVGRRLWAVGSPVAIVFLGYDCAAAAIAIKVVAFRHGVIRATR